MSDSDDKTLAGRAAMLNQNLIMATHLHECYLAFQEAGFPEHHAYSLTEAMLVSLMATLQNPGTGI